MIKKVSLYLICFVTASILGGFTFVVSGGLAAINNKQNVGFPLIIGLVFFSLSFLIFTRNARNSIRWDEELDEMKSRTYQDYIKRHPENYKNGKVTCRSCGSSSLGARSVKRGFFMTSHYCRQCGEDLYYSKEKH